MNSIRIYPISTFVSSNPSASGYSNSSRNKDENNSGCDEQSFHEIFMQKLEKTKCPLGFDS